MLLIVFYFLLAVDLRTTTYGFGEWNCGDVGTPRPCDKNAITASGEAFDPKKLSAAMPGPKWLRMRGMDIGVWGTDGHCYRVRLNDKSNPRFIQKRGLDVSPAVVGIANGFITKWWHRPLNFCPIKKDIPVDCLAILKGYPETNHVRSKLRLNYPYLVYWDIEHVTWRTLLKVTSQYPLWQSDWKFALNCDYQNNTYYLYVKRY